ncbi:MAG TPA: hypothetical protein VJ770_22950 [Stellaceae bacterium]|nr:hypothetical protein [Stellaceae bacterium]
MPIYAIARGYKLPIYQHLIVEAPDFATACRKAIEHDDWQSSSEDYDGCGPTYLTAAVCVRERRADEDPRSLLYSDLPALDIPAEFADEDEQKQPPAEYEAETIHVLVIAHQLGGNPFHATTRFITSAHRSEAGAKAALAAFCRRHWMDLFDDEDEGVDIPADEAEAVRKFFAAAEGQASWELTRASIGP